MTSIRIGLTDIPKELSLELAISSDAFLKELGSALETGAGMLWLTDTLERRVGIAPSKIAYVEIEPEGPPRPVGFGAAE